MVELRGGGPAVTSAVDVSVCLRWLITGQTGAGHFLELWEPVLLSLPVTPAPFLLLSSVILFWMWVEGVRVTQSVTSLLSFSFRPPSESHKRFDTLSAHSLTAARTTWNFPLFGQSGELSFLFRLEWTVAVGFDNSKLSNWNLRGFNSGATTRSFLWWCGASQATDGLKVITSNQFKKVQGVV